MYGLTALPPNIQPAQASGAGFSFAQNIYGRKRIQVVTGNQRGGRSKSLVLFRLRNRWRTTTCIFAKYGMGS